MMESRREFIKKSALAGAGLPLMGTSLLNEPLKNAYEVSDKTGNIPIFAFSKHFQFLEDFGELSDAILEAGLDGIDLTVRPGGHVEPEEVEEAPVHNHYLWGNPSFAAVSLLGQGHVPKFVKRFADLKPQIQSALAAYKNEVEESVFPEK